MQRIELPHPLGSFEAYWENTDGKVVEIVLLGPSKKTFEQGLVDYPSLRRLTLNRVRLHKTIWLQVGMLAELQDLTVSRTDIDAVGISAIARCSELRSLDLRCTLINEKALGEIGELVDLQKLILISTPVRNIDPISKLRNLRVLYLTQTDIGDEHLHVLSNCEELRELHLEGTKISDIGLEQVIHCPNLKMLAIQNTHVSNRVYRVLANLTNLEELYVDQEIDSTSIADLRKLHHLQRIYCGDTIPEEQQELLRQSLEIEVF